MRGIPTFPQPRLRPEIKPKTGHFTCYENRTF
jgi:hypothetical protein